MSEHISDAPENKPQSFCEGMARIEKQPNITLDAFVDQDEASWFLPWFMTCNQTDADKMAFASSTLDHWEEVLLECSKRALENDAHSGKRKLSVQESFSSFLELKKQRRVKVAEWAGDEQIGVTPPSSIRWSSAPSESAKARSNK